MKKRRQNQLTREELDKLIDQFYGVYDEDIDDYDGTGVYEEKQELADWALVNVPKLFEAVSNLLKNGEDE